MKIASIFVFSFFLIGAAFCSTQKDNDYIAKCGGELLLRGKGWLSVIDCRSNPAHEDYVIGEKKVRLTFAIEIRHIAGSSFSVTNAHNLLHRYGGNVAVFIIDDPSLPMSLSAPEDRWAMLNVAQIKSDKPDVKKFQHRISILFTRQCCRVLGSDEAKGTDTCFHTILKVADIDAITSFDLPMGPELAIPETLEPRGIEAIQWGTYQDACELGIAPKPTNDIQRAIWEKVHAPPSKPIKITYDKDKQKPVVK